MFTKSLKVTDFTGHNIYVGLDVHHKSWMISIYSDEFELKTFSQPPDALLLGNYLRKHYPNATFRLAYEAGFCGFGYIAHSKPKGLNATLFIRQIFPVVIKSRNVKLMGLIDSNDLSYRNRRCSPI